MRVLLLLAVSLPLLATPLLTEEQAALFYSRNFPGSRPPYMEIRLQPSGALEYREGPDEDNPVIFKLTAEQTREVYTLAGRLGHFDRKLESDLPVARMGEKTFRWTRGKEVREQKFNYSTDLDAQALHDWFERMCESAQRFIDLERAAKYDRLGVNKAILLIEAAWDRRRLVGLELFLPLLDRVAKSESYLNMARERAAGLAATFRNPPPPKDEAKEK